MKSLKNKFLVFMTLLSLNLITSTHLAYADGDDVCDTIKCAASSLPFIIGAGAGSMVGCADSCGCSDLRTGSHDTHNHYYFINTGYYGHRTTEVTDRAKDCALVAAGCAVGYCVGFGAGTVGSCACRACHACSQALSDSDDQLAGPPHQEMTIAPAMVNTTSTAKAIPVYASQAAPPAYNPYANKAKAAY